MPSKLPSSHAIQNAVVAAQQAISALPDDEDYGLLISTVEGESDVLEVIDRVVEAAIADAKLVELARERARRIEERAKRTRNVALQIIEALGISPLERPLFTASVSYHRELGSLNEAELPDEWFRRAPDKIAIAKALRAGQDIPGASLGNDQPRLTIRTA
jgi:hypothetical protein